MKKAVPLALLAVMTLAAAAALAVAERQPGAATQPEPAVRRGAAARPAEAGPVTVTAGNARVYFSPRGGCTEAIVAELEQARESVLIQAYSFTSEPIASAAVAAHRRGVRVRAILDKSQRSEKYSELDFLTRAGVPTLVDARHAIAHNKVMVIDGRTAITGSFNFTKAAEEKNAENLLIVRDRELARRYAENWEEHAAHSEEHVGK